MPPVKPIEPAEPVEPVEPSVPGGRLANVPAIERRVSDWIDHMNMRLFAIDERGDEVDEDSESVFLIKDVFTTINGSWEVSDAPYAIPQWARDEYLKPWGAPDYFDDAGADHHIFAAVIGLDGQLQRQAPDHLLVGRL